MGSTLHGLPCGVHPAGTTLRAPPCGHTDSFPQENLPFICRVHTYRETFQFKAE